MPRDVFVMRAPTTLVVTRDEFLALKGIYGRYERVDGISPEETAAMEAQIRNVVDARLSEGDYLLAVDWEDLRSRVGVSSMDSMPAAYTATLVDSGQTFQATEAGENGEAEAVACERAVRRVVAQALAARKVGPSKL